MEIENDFEVIFENGISILKGHLIDSTEINFLKDPFSKSREISFARLNSVSWLGIQRLYELILNLENAIKLSNIPPHIYRILLLFPDFGKKVGIKSFQVEVFNKQCDIIKTVMTLDKLAELGKTQGCFAKLTNGETICGSLHHLCRPFFNDYNLPKKNYSSKWCIENKDLCNFFYEYTCFTRLVLEICSLAQESTSRLIEESLQNICTRVSNLEFSIKNIDPNFSEYKSRYLMSLMPNIHEISKSVVLAINLSSTTFEAVVQTFEALFMRDKLDSSEIFNQMKDFINFSDQLIPIAKNLEDVGVELGDNVLKYGDFGTLHQTFKTFNGDHLTEKSLSTIRRKLKMDQYINLTWHDTYNEIISEFKSIDTELSRCIVALQGFDLVRQVLEHRITEINIFKENLHLVRSNQMSLEKLKEKILVQIVDRLVTDQEKFSYSFFFPDSTIKENKSKVTSGDPVFF
ncbi:hypothetical protein [Silvanigrella sp.]|jgi:hypothetical protein|uniref:hypothetical protein n=1 Tax=Silvanigrella sp. TaxID=2024976 RepID=UPI0037C8955A